MNFSHSGLNYFRTGISCLLGLSLGALALSGAGCMAQDVPNQESDTSQDGTNSDGMDKGQFLNELETPDFANSNAVPSLPTLEGDDDSGEVDRGQGSTVDNAGDQCPDDELKDTPGVCGCGLSETDSDSDGTPDCVDECPDDPEKNTEGVCGCFLGETDTDDDGLPDCLDLCEFDPDKTEPGLCGCGNSEDCGANIGPGADLFGLSIVAADGQFLGIVSLSFDVESIANPVGPYGSVVSATSVWSLVGIYGNAVSTTSAWSPVATSPPIITDGESFIYLTANATLIPAIHPEDLAIMLGRLDVLDGRF